MSLVAGFAVAVLPDALPIWSAYNIQTLPSRLPVPHKGRAHATLGTPFTRLLNLPLLCLGDCVEHSTF